MKTIAEKMIIGFKKQLINEEKNSATVEKYMRDILKFKNYCQDMELTKETVLKYKKEIIENYALTSVNSMLSSLNSFFEFIERKDLKIRTVKVQKQVFMSEEKSLSKAEYEKLLKIAEKRKNRRLYLVMQCICSTGIRVSELKYITAEALESEKTQINNKGKYRVVFLPHKLCKILKAYIKQQKISSGPVFVTKNGKPLDRSNICNNMKKLCKEAGVAREKVFPHNLRHLFARTYYSMQKDIVRLADILGHSSINTTRIYTMETGEIHKKQIQKLGLLLC